MTVICVMILIQQRYRRTDRRSDGRHAIARPRFAP